MNRIIMTLNGQSYTSAHEWNTLDDFYAADTLENEFPDYKGDGSEGESATYELERPIKVMNASGTEIHWDSAEQHMSANICNALSEKIAPCSEQEFFTAYEEAHKVEFGEAFFLSAANPAY